MYITITRTSTFEYTDIPTGYLEVSSLSSFCAQHGLIAQNDGTYVAEWGNGEGFDTFEIEAEETPTLNITIPDDMLWVDADPAEFRVKETEQAFIDQFSRLLAEAGYKAEITFGLVNSTKIEDEDGYVDDERLWEIYTILDRVDPQYIKAEAADADADADADPDES